MHGIDIMALQAAGRARKPHLVWAQQRAGEIEEQGHAENHNDDRDQAANRAGKGDVAKAGRRQGRDGEIQRVGIVRDLIVAKFLGFRKRSRSSRR
jgi:hypothetical protein